MFQTNPKRSLLSVTTPCATSHQSVIGSCSSLQRDDLRGLLLGAAGLVGDVLAKLLEPRAVRELLSPCLAGEHRLDELGTVGVTDDRVLEMPPEVGRHDLRHDRLVVGTTLVGLLEEAVQVQRGTLLLQDAPESRRKIVDTTPEAEDLLTELSLTAL